MCDCPQHPIAKETSSWQEDIISFDLIRVAKSGEQYAQAGAIFPQTKWPMLPFMLFESLHLRMDVELNLDFLGLPLCL